ncbi:MAG: hypothetical protein R3E39_12135 [Anaerolineae bacterium]
MSVEGLVFIVLVVTTIYNLGVQAYIHFEAYPLLSSVGKTEFPAYLKAYEDHLTIPLLAPYGLTLLSNVILLFGRPSHLTVLEVIAALVLNLSVSLVTQFVASPVYNKVKQSGEASGPDMARLMQINMLRLVLSLLAVAVIVVMLWTALNP